MRASSNQSRAGVRYRTYACTHNHVSWRREDLDAAVSAKVEAWLVKGLPALRQARAEMPADRTGDAAREPERLREELAEADALRLEGVLTLRAYAAESARIETRLAEVEALSLPALPDAARRGPWGQ